VDDGAPGRAVALDVYAPLRESPGREIVEHEIEAQPRRHAVGGGVAEKRRAEVIVGQLGEIPFDAHLPRSRTRSWGAARPSRPPGRRRPSRNCCRRKSRGPRDTRFPGEPGEADRRRVVDVVGDRRVQVAQRIIRQRRQVDHRVEALDVSAPGHRGDQGATLERLGAALTVAGWRPQIATKF